VFSLLQARRIRGSAGEPLPVVFKALEDKGTNFVRGQLALVAAGPGTGKSAFVLSYALLSNVPTLYFSADSDAFVQLTRSIAILKEDWSLEQAAKAVLDGETASYSVDLADKPIRFNFSASPTLDEIERAMAAYEEVYGEFPALVVIDNVTNVIGGSGGDEDPFSGLESLMDYFATMARNTEACVIGLHHVTGPYVDADKPIPLSGVKGQITRVPAMVLTLHRVAGEQGYPDILCVSTVKNRGGKSDPSGYNFAMLEFRGENMSITDPTEGRVIHPAVSNPWQS
jgi:hypothetical protein